MAALMGNVRPLLSQYFKPALLARMTILPYRILEPEVLRDIVRLKFGKLAERLKSQHKMTMHCSDAVIDQVTMRCTEVETGARNIDYIISGNILPRLSTEILACMGAGALPGEVIIDVDDRKGFNISFCEHQSTGVAHA
jgi:type VI secretion system protein VasG